MDVLNGKVGSSFVYYTAEGRGLDMLTENQKTSQQPTQERSPIKKWEYTRVWPDLIFLAGCRKYSRIIRHVG